jgi:hypothetical protein
MTGFKYYFVFNSAGKIVNKSIKLDNKSNLIWKLIGYLNEFKTYKLLLNIPLMKMK